jgi:putative cardiolipin synthase
LHDNGFGLEAVTTTALAPIRRPFDALAARVALIDEASSRLDLQYYQWDSDNVGYLLLDRLIAAADRGVAVRLLIDDLKLRSRTRRAASLCLHPHIAVRFFNPWTRRSNMATEALEFVRRFSKLDRRMHNKLLVADGRRAIVGGRNIADAHYGLNKAFNLVDYDVLLTGAGASALADVFETYWTSPPAIPASALDSSVSKSDLDAARTLVNRQVSERAGALPPGLTTNPAWRDRVASDTLMVPEGALHITFDVPGPTSDTRPTQVISALHGAVAGARNELVVVTPFFVPNEMDVEFCGRLTDGGVRIRLLTNSLASNSGTISNSGLDRSRKAVVKAGVELYELRNDAADKAEWVTAPNVGGYLGLHAKLYTIDREQVFLGSVNLDPRSKAINTEIGMLVENAEFAREAAEDIERLMAPDNSWRVALDGDDRLTWTNDAETTHRQPARNVGQRIADKVFEILPIDRYI